MKSSKASPSRFKKVYGLPTLRGLLLSSILIGALWFSTMNNSETERWMFLLMILLILVHLTESSQPFRSMQPLLLPFEPPFEGEQIQIPVQISNQTNFKLDSMSMKFEGEKTWTEVKSIARRSSGLVHLPLRFDRSGETKLARLILRTSPVPRLFRYWRHVDFTETTLVLPKPVDHQLTGLRSHEEGDVELTDLEQIRDERLLPFADQKLLLKTGLPFRRVHESVQTNDRIAFSWSQLASLTQIEKGQQFSFWIKSASELKRNIEISIETPFVNSSQNSRSVNWRKLKITFAKWFYAQS